MFFSIFKHLLPRAAAWTLIVEKTLRQYFEGLAETPDDIYEYLDLVYLDLFPQTTRQLDEWFEVWALRSSGMTDAEKRDRLEAAWSALGGQSPSYIQTTLRAAGFDVYVHEWWEPGTEPALGVHGSATARNPNLVLYPTSAGLEAGVECGESFAACGEPSAEAGNILTGLGYPLVNKVTRTVTEYTVLCGEAVAECGEAAAESGERTGLINKDLLYAIPADVTKWPYFLYIGDSTFGDLAGVPASRRGEFEELCLKICPLEQWLGIMVVYT